MTALIVISVIFLFILFLLLLRLKIVLKLNNDEISVKIKLLGITFFKLPKKEKKVKIRSRDYSYKKVQKRKLKEEKQAEKLRSKRKKELTKKAKEAHDTDELKNAPLAEKISFITRIAKIIIRKLLKYIRIDITEIDISVSTGDAAKTAIAYAGVRQAVAILLDLLEHGTNIYKHRKTYISVSPNFTDEKTRAKINITLSVKTWQILSILLSAVIEMLKKAIKENKTTKGNK